MAAADEAGAFQVFRGGGGCGNGRRRIRLLLLIGRHPGDFSQPLTSPKVALTSADIRLSHSYCICIFTIFWGAAKMWQTTNAKRRTRATERESGESESGTASYGAARPSRCTHKFRMSLACPHRILGTTFKICACGLPHLANDMREWRALSDRSEK